jgi:hypothetical protein
MLWKEAFAVGKAAGKARNRKTVPYLPKWQDRRIFLSIVQGQCAVPFILASEEIETWNTRKSDGKPAKRRMVHTAVCAIVTVSQS